MDGYLLDTSCLSALLNPGHRDHTKVCSALERFDEAAPKYVSIIAFGELKFGWRTAQALGHGSLDTFKEVISTVAGYPLLGSTKHTAEEYSELKAILAKTYLKKALRKDRPRWLEDWVDQATGQKLQVDENDLWMCAQARERNLIFVTTDGKMERIEQADTLLQLLVI